MEKLWANLHGGSTHFPIALMIASFLFDALAYVGREPYKRDLHDFVWPAFGLMVGLATWRLVVRNDAARPAFGVYLACAALTAVLMAAAGYFGGELMGS